MFTWRQPIGGKEVRWKPLTLGQEMDVEANFRRDELRHLMKYETLRLRIIGFGDADHCSMQEFRLWDSSDVEEFVREVEGRELARRAAFRKERAAKGFTAQFETLCDDLKITSKKLNELADDMLAIAKNEEAAGGGSPLGTK